MSCKYCGLKLREEDRFVVIGDYPNRWRALGRIYARPEYIGELYHQACYLESIGKLETKQKKEGVTP